MLTENKIIDLLDQYFQDQQYKTIKKYTNQRGVDMEIIDPNGQTVYIEVKGETSSKAGTARYGQPFSGTQIWTHVSVALMKTIVDMSKPEHKGIKFAMAFPNNHEPMVERIRDAVVKLGINVYFVSENMVRVFQ